MKIYKGKRNYKDIGGQTIVVQDNGEEYLLEYIKRHSQEFNWGFGGSGPADTALSILTDCLGMEQANQLYQLFKREFVAGWDDEWSISEERIREWIEKQENK